MHTTPTESRGTHTRTAHANTNADRRHLTPWCRTHAHLRRRTLLARILQEAVVVACPRRPTCCLPLPAPSLSSCLIFKTLVLKKRRDEPTHKTRARTRRRDQRGRKRGVPLSLPPKTLCALPQPAAEPIGSKKNSRKKYTGRGLQSGKASRPHTLIFKNWCLCPQKIPAWRVAVYPVYLHQKPSRPLRGARTERERRRGYLRVQSRVRGSAQSQAGVSRGSRASALGP